jgi:hypothetical protein
MASLRHGVAGILGLTDSTPERLLDPAVSSIEAPAPTKTNASPLRSGQLYTDAAPTSTAAVHLGPPRRSTVQHYTDARNIAYAEMAAALKGLIWVMTTILQEPTNITLYTDLSV